MSVLEVGDNFPGNVAFGYIPFTPETKDITSCGIPIKFDASEGKAPLFSPNLPTFFSFYLFNPY